MQNKSRSKFIFKCKRCGFCCHGETTVSLDKEDQERMLHELNITKEQALDKYWRRSGNVVQMKVVEGHCIFFSDGCTVHKVRPKKCREWPLVQAMIVDKVNFESIKESCPALKDGCSYEDVVAEILNQHNQQ